MPNTTNKPRLVIAALVGLIAGFGYVTHRNSQTEPVSPNAKSTTSTPATANKEVRQASTLKPTKKTEKSLSALSQLVVKANQGLTADLPEDHVPSQQDLDALSSQINELDQEIDQEDWIARANQGELSQAEQSNFGELLRTRAQLSVAHAKGLLARIKLEENEQQAAYAQREY